MFYFTMRLRCPAVGCREVHELWLHAEQRPEADSTLHIRCSSTAQPLRIPSRFLKDVKLPPDGVETRPLGDMLFET